MLVFDAVSHWDKKKGTAHIDSAFEIDWIVYLIKIIFLESEYLPDDIRYM
jgi:hypothetical protein